MNRITAFATALVLAAALALGCSGDDEENGPQPQPDLPAATATPAAETPTEAPPSELPPAEPLAWYDCGAGSLECADFDVPLDYARPDGETITLAVRRLAASGERIGILFVNPGGPGGSTIATLSGWARTLPSEVRESFDVILFDPRGVGLSSPLRCFEDIQAVLGLNPYPETDAEWRELEDAARQQGEDCNRVAGNVLPHLGTANVARDMDRMREALGETQLNYFGYSYGTTLGQVYADLFPRNIRAMVLDGAVDIAITPQQRSHEQILGFEAAFGRYLADCRSRACLAGDPAEIIRGLMAQVEGMPIPALAGDRSIGPGELQLAILGSLYSRATWPLLSAGLNAALRGDGTSLLVLADTFMGRRPDGSYSNLLEANIAVNCIDYPVERDPAVYRRWSAESAREAPIFGLSIGASGLTCAFWPAEPTPLSPPRAEGAPPILVIGTTGDPATPYKWAVALAEQLESSVLLTRDGEGHLAYRMGSNCIDAAVNVYLVELEVPPEGTVCGNAGIEPVPPVP